MKTNTIQILSILIILTTISSQDLLGAINSTLPSGVAIPSGLTVNGIIGNLTSGALPSGLNVTGIIGNLTSGVLPSGISGLIPSSFNTSALIPSGLIADSKAILDNFKNGAIKSKLPTDIDFSNPDQINKILGDLNAENFDFDSKEMIPNIKELTGNSTCIKRLKNIFEFMSMAEQVAFYSAYEAKLSANSTAENQGRCFAPRTLHKTFKNINKGNMQAMNKKMTQDSKEIRNSFSCVGKSFKQLKLQGDYKPVIEGFLNVQGTSNQCKSSFIKTLVQTLGARRRYLLLDDKDSNSTAIKDAEGNIVGFSWLESEVETITKSFLTFAECYQGLPEAVTKTYADVLNKISSDPVCTNAEAKRLLQGTTTSPIGGAITDAVKNTVTDAVKAANSTAIDAIKTATNNLPSNITDAIKSAVLPSGNITDAIKNAIGSISGSGNITDAIKSAISGIPSASALISQVKAIIKKQKSIGNIVFAEESKTELNNISADLSKKEGDYITVGNMIKGFVTAEDLKSKCNMPGLLKGLLKEKSDALEKVVYNEIKKMDKNEACTGDYLVYISKPKGGSQGKITCNSADTVCQNTTFEFKENVNDSSLTMVASCINSRRFILGYFDDTKFGKGLDYASKTFSTCKKGESNRCAQEFAKMKKNPKNSRRVLQEEAECVPKMKRDCEDVIATNCESSKLFENIEELTPSKSDSALPKECQNVDPVNPNYVNCFTWINKNLIAFTIFPELKKIENLQGLINESQAARLRLLQETQIKIVKTDASSTDTVAQIPASEVTLTASDVEIDGSTPDKVTISSDAVAEIDNSSNTNSNTAASFNKFGYVLIASIIALMA